MGHMIKGSSPKLFLPSSGKTVYCHRSFQPKVKAKSVMGRETAQGWSSSNGTIRPGSPATKWRVQTLESQYLLCPWEFQLFLPPSRDHYYRHTNSFGVTFTPRMKAR